MTQQHPRDDCYFCGSSEDIETHHIVPRRYNGLDKNENLVDLCRDCHNKIESLYDAEFYGQFGQINRAVFLNHYGYIVANWENKRFGPDKCYECDRYGPFTDVTPAPRGLNPIECARCGQMYIHMDEIEEMPPEIEP